MYKMLELQQSVFLYSSITSYPKRSSKSHFYRYATTVVDIMSTRKEIHLNVCFNV